MNVRESRVERERLTFSAFGDQLAQGLSEAADASQPDQALLEDEVKIGCTTGMLLCLDRQHRIAYILGDVFELRSDDAADVLGIAPTAFRKRLSRARERVRDFMRGHCGLVNPEAACRCGRRVEAAVKLGRVDPARLLFASRPRGDRQPLPVLEEIGEMEMLHEIAGVFQSHPEYAVPERVVDGVRNLIVSRRFRLFD